MNDDDFKHDWMIKATSVETRRRSWRWYRGRLRLGITTRIYFRGTQTKAEKKCRQKQANFKGKVTLYMLTLWPVDLPD